MNDDSLSRRVLLGRAAGTSLLLCLPGLPSCASVAFDRAAPRPPQWNDDVRLGALACAVLAPSAHNTQPWRVALRGSDALDLFVDRERLLPETDPPARQIHISQGTFLEHLDIGARELGQRLDVAYFPEGEYGPAELEDRPVARVRFSPAATLGSDPLYAEVHRRLSNRRPFDRTRALTPLQGASLSSAAPPDWATFRALTSAEQLRRLSGMLGEAMGVESSNRRRNEETARWFRFSQEELDRQRDGFGLPHEGVSGLSRWFIESFVLDRRGAGDPKGAFATGAVERARLQADGVSAFGVLSTRGNTRLLQVLAGRAYARVALTASALGVAIHPMTQVTEEYADMDALRDAFHRLCSAEGEVPQMVVRLGFAEPHPHPPRREVAALLR
jgi:hypothetical protein